MPRLFRLSLTNQGFAFDPATGESFVLNPTGATVLRGLQDGQNEGQLAQTLSQRFGISLDIAAHDIGEFLTRLSAFHLT